MVGDSNTARYGGDELVETCLSVSRYSIITVLQAIQRVQEARVSQWRGSAAGRHIKETREYNSFTIKTRPDQNQRSCQKGGPWTSLL
jgi:hypothetical protein